MAYIDPDLLADEVSNAEAALAGIADQTPGWEPHEGHVETVIAEAWGASLATAIQVLRDEAARAYARLGELIDVHRIPAASAETTATFTFGQPVPVLAGGTLLNVTALAGTNLTFAVLEDQDGGTAGATVMTAVPIVAVDPGPEANGAAGEAFTDELVTVDSIVLDAPAAGGQDEEPFDAYLARITDRMRRVRALPVTPEDFAAMALDVPGVARAYAVNRYDPATPTLDVPGVVTVFALGATGAALGTAVRGSLVAYYAGVETILGTRVVIADPAETTVTVAATVQASADLSPDDVGAQAAAAITTAFDPATRDVDEDAPGRWARPTPTVNDYDVAAVIDDIPGVRVIEITLNGGRSVALAAPLTIPRLVGVPVVTVVSA